MKKIVSIVLSAALLSGCATASSDVQATFVSPVQYSSYDCTQIEAQMMSVSNRVRDAAGAQDKKAKNDKIAMGVGLVLFWPALFFLAGSDQKAQLAQLKGEYDALNVAGIQKKCNLVTK